MEDELVVPLMLLISWFEYNWIWQTVADDALKFEKIFPAKATAAEGGLQQICKMCKRSFQWKKILDTFADADFWDKLRQTLKSKRW